MNAAFPLAAALLLTACATTQTTRDTSPTFTYTDPAGQSRVISGEIHRNAEVGLFQTTWTYKLVTYADGQPLASGYLDPRNYQGVVGGSLDGKPAVANCTSLRRSRDWVDVTCEISIAGNKAGILRF